MPIRSLARSTLAFAAMTTVLVDVAKIQRSLVLALRSLWLHKLRSLLSVLGIIIGTFSVIALMAFGEGSMQDAMEDIRRQGATNIIVRSVKPPDDSATSRRTMIAEYGLKYMDFERFGTIPGITRIVPLRVFPQEIRRLQFMAHGRVVGTTTEYSNVHELSLVRGRFLTQDDDANMDNV